MHIQGDFKDYATAVSNKVDEIRSKDFVPKARRIKIKTKNKDRVILIPDKDSKEVLKIINDYIKIKIGFHPFFDSYSFEDFSISGNRQMLWIMIKSIIHMTVKNLGFIAIFDIKDYFPSIRPEHLEYLKDAPNVPNDFYDTILKYCFVNEELPLGFPTSPTVAFLATRNLMKILACSPIITDDGKFYIKSRPVVRYCDNFMMFIPYDESGLSPKNVKSFIHVVLKNKNLKPKFIEIYDKNKLEEQMLEFLNVRFKYDKDADVIRFKFPRKFTKMAAYFLHTEKEDEKFKRRRRGYEAYMKPILQALGSSYTATFSNEKYDIIQEASKFEFYVDRESVNLSRSVFVQSMMNNSYSWDLETWTNFLNTKMHINDIIAALKENGFKIHVVGSVFPNSENPYLNHRINISHYTENTDKEIVKIGSAISRKSRHIIIAENDRFMFVIRI